jgi:hypothetical protein
LYLLWVDPSFHLPTPVRLHRDGEPTHLRDHDGQPFLQCALALMLVAVAVVVVRDVDRPRILQTY